MSHTGSSGPVDPKQATGAATTTPALGQDPARPGESVNDWSASEEASAKAEKSASLYLKLTNDGDRVTFAVAQPPLPVARHGSQESSTYSSRRCIGVDAGCPSCARGDRPRTQHMFAVVPVGEATRKVLTISELTFRAFRELARRYLPDRTTYELTRQGRPRDPQTRYLVMPAGEIPPEVHAVIASTPPLDLDALSWGREGAPGTDRDDRDDGPVPF